MAQTERQKKYRATEKYKEIRRAYYRRIMSEYRRDRGAPVQVWLRNLMKHQKQKNQSHRKRLLENDLTLEFLLDLYAQQRGCCFVSGRYMTTRQRDVDAISIDRIDSNIGYLKSNVVLVCRWVNVGRGAHCSLEDFATRLSSPACLLNSAWETISLKQIGGTKLWLVPARNGHKV